MINKLFEKLIKHRLGNDTMLKMQVRQGYLKTKQGHGPLLTKLLKTQNSLNFGSLGACQSSG